MVSAFSLSENIMGQDAADDSSTGELQPCYPSLSEVRDLKAEDKMQDIKSLMWKYVSLLRSSAFSKRARRKLEELSSCTTLLSTDYATNTLRNMHCVARLVVEAAAKRKRSCGVHHVIECGGKGNNLAPSLVEERRG
jgi:aspartate oxidase